MTQGSRDAVETAIDLAKDNKEGTWEELTSEVKGKGRRIKRWEEDTSGRTKKAVGNNTYPGDDE